METSSGDQPQAKINAVQASNIDLSPRQIECLYWVQEGKSSRDIGTILGVSHRIVERHVFRACKKLGVRTRLQAVIRARSLGVLDDASQEPGQKLD
ncbi:helix-turn-helix transcriptional regulator [Phenylobacterium sp. J426]|uniref:helix-turn-helix domain-containing protein n=1 Tax=Phenylobacterium sp. J426 TaxID=2898439 RepID=UPI002150E6BD|nr:helix-turn-helix transcriptional regulator [Phenylobacterium sp. J426]MCR5876636.1 helix-turn-helix transcriptional regulator [Phenylobacterium sp. J426]